MEAHSRALSGILTPSVGIGNHFHVPKYQREYTWGRKEWAQLLDDLYENDPGYFMGSIICVSGSGAAPPGAEIIYELTDGQQRLTTLSLLLGALYVALTQAHASRVYEDPLEKQDIDDILATTRGMLVKRKAEPIIGEPGGFVVVGHTYFLRVQPSAQNHNLEDYRFALSEAGLLPGQLRPAYCGVRNVYKAFAYFRESLPEDVQTLRDLAERIGHLTFVLITVGTSADAFTLFESLNNRGIPLSPIDIIKNDLLATMDRRHLSGIDESFDRWQGIVAALPDVTEQERFLRHFYNAFKHRPEVAVAGVTRATRSQIIRIYEQLIEQKPTWVFDELSEKSSLYGELAHPGDGDHSELSSALREVPRIGAAPAYQVLLFLAALPPGTFQPADFLAKAARLLAKYYVRRNVTDIPATRDLDPASIELIEACNKHIEQHGGLTLEVFAALMRQGGSKPASLDQFRAALAGPIYAENAGMARYLLVQLDLLHQTREYEPDLWARDERSRYVWTVEHVLPQTERLPVEWIEMLAGGDTHLAAERQAHWVNRLGNLTLSGYNSELSKAPFAKKQQLAKDQVILGHKINIGYRNHLALNELSFPFGKGTTLANAPFWTVELIEARTDEMVRFIVETNRLPGD